MCLAHLEEESAQRDEEVEIEDPDGIDRVIEELVVHLAWTVKDAQPWALYLQLSTSESLQREYAVKLQGGNGIKEGSPDPSDEDDSAQETSGGDSQGVTWPKQTPFLNPDPFQHWHGAKNVAKVKNNRESCEALLDNGTEINTITPNYVKNHSLEMGPITDLIGTRVTCLGLGNTYTWFLGYVIVQVQVDGVQGYDEDQIALVIPDESKFAEWIPIIWKPPL